MSLYCILKTVENIKNNKSVKFQGDTLNFYDFIQVYVFTTNHHLKFRQSVFAYEHCFPLPFFGVCSLEVIKGYSCESPH